MILILKLLASFGIGSIPFAKLAMLGTGVDITQVGSKNPGFNNVLRVSTKWRAAIALVGDISKGYVALWLLSRGQTSPVELWAIGIASVVGHCWSPFLGFSGGKGVATTVGVLLFLEPRITIPCLPLYVLLRMFGRKMMKWRQEGAIASLSTMFVIATVVFAFRGLESGLFAYALFGIILIRHIPNLRELERAPDDAWEPPRLRR
jgi:acyl phosphate:glycerol-3-phosphate acyltransferase